MHFRQRAAEYLGAVGKFSFPLLLQSDVPGKFRLWASGVGIHKDGKHYLLTAQHSIERGYHFGAQDIFIGNGEQDPKPMHLIPEGMAPAWRYHPNPAIDIAVLPIPMKFNGLAFFDIKQVTRGHLPTMRGHHFLAGYPLSKNKLQHVNPPGQPARQTGILSVIVKVDPDLDFKGDGKNPSEHLGFTYERVYVEGELHERGVALNGLSGCGLWYFPHENINERFYLAGVLIEWYKSMSAYASFARNIAVLLD